MLAVCQRKVSLLTCDTKCCSSKHPSVQWSCMHCPTAACDAEQLEEQSWSFACLGCQSSGVDVHLLIQQLAHPTTEARLHAPGGDLPKHTRSVPASQSLAAGSSLTHSTAWASACCCNHHQAVAHPSSGMRPACGNHRSAVCASSFTRTWRLAEGGAEVKSWYPSSLSASTAVVDRVWEPDGDAATPLSSGQREATAAGSMSASCFCLAEGDACSGCLCGADWAGTAGPAGVCCEVTSVRSVTKCWGEEIAGWPEAVLGSSSPNRDKSRGADLHMTVERRPGIMLTTRFMLRAVGRPVPVMGDFGVLLRVPCCLGKVSKVLLLKLTGALNKHAGHLGGRWLRSGFFISPKVLFGLCLLLYWLR